MVAVDQEGFPAGIGGEAKGSQTGEDHTLETTGEEVIWGLKGEEPMAGKIIGTAGGPISQPRSLECWSILGSLHGDFYDGRGIH